MQLGLFYTPLQAFAVAMVTVGACIEATGGVDPMSYDEIADELGLTVREVKDAERSGLAKLRRSGALLEMWKP